MRLGRESRRSQRASSQPIVSHLDNKRWYNEERQLNWVTGPLYSAVAVSDNTGRSSKFVGERQIKHARTIGQTICDWARRTPAAVAILASGQAPMTYGGLATQIDQVGDILNTAGVRRGNRIAVVIPNGPELATLIVGIASYATVVPLNPALTEVEFSTLLSDLEAKAVIVNTGSDTPARAAAAAVGIVVIELAAEDNNSAGTFRLIGAGAGPRRQAEQAEADDVALVLHTSGTTSRPKRVPLTHANLMASATRFGDWYALGPDDRCLSIMPYYHSHGMFGGIMASLASGGSIACARGFDDVGFFALLDEFRATWYTAAPTFHQAIVARAGRHRDVIDRNPLRFIRSSSAPLAPQTMLELEDTFGAPVLEGYGLSETCMHSLSNPLPPAPRKPGCVGLPAGTEAAIIDESGNQVTQGVSGEVVLRGPTVMSGYEANPEVNGAAFIDGWFRTGDQGHFDEDGYLVLTGRFKELINRGGEKIAPLEIDHVLLDHPDVAQAVAFSIPHPTLGEEIGVAIVRRDGAEIGEADIRAFSAKALANFKVPRLVVFVDDIPKSTTGKSQRLGLAEKLGVTRLACAGQVGGSRQGETPIETAVGEIWRRTLQLDAIGVDDDFFLIGGDSLQAIHVIDDIYQQFDVDIPVDAIFAAESTITGMAQTIEEQLKNGHTRVRPRPGPVHRDVPLPASFAQQSCWVGSTLFRDQPIYNVASALRLIGQLDLEALTQSLVSLVDRHECMRIQFAFEDGRLIQVPSSVETTVLEFFDVREIAGDNDEMRATAWAQQETQRPLDAAKGPLWRLALLRRDRDDHILLVLFHHAIIDGLAREILIDDLFEFYAGVKDGSAPALMPLDVQYSDFGAWQRRCWDDGGFDVELAYWRDKLAGLPPILRLPADRPRTELPSWHGRKATIALAPDLSRVLEDFGRARHATLFMTLLAAFDVLLHAHTGSNDLVIGVPLENRPTRDFEQVVGCFVNTMPFRTDLGGDPTFEEVLAQIRRTATEAYANLQIPYEMLIDDLVPHRSIGQDAIFGMLFQLRNFRHRSRKAAGGLTIEPFEFDPGITRFDLSVEWENRGDGLVCRCTYRTALFDDATVTGWLNDYRTILETVVTDPARRLSEL